jgi:sarcosine oxidase subunit beta
MQPCNEEQGVDVLVIGAGIIGASCAYHCSALGRSVAVVEALSTYAAGSTGRSFASVRGQWADRLNIELSWRSIQRYRDFANDHGLDVGYRATGYLFLFPQREWQQHQAAVELQRSLGVPVEVLDVPAAQRLSSFDPAGIAGATWGPEDGQVDPHGATSAFLTLARRNDARAWFGAPVVEIAENTDASWSVLAGGRRFRAQLVVNAAGGWSGEVAALAGMDVPVGHSRRNVYATAAGSCTRPVPLTIDVATGVAVRSEGDRLLFYGSHRPDQADGYDIAVDLDWMQTVLETSVERFPYLADMPIDTRAAWAGTYDLCPDHTAIVGADPAHATWVNACGFSGHGVMQAPEVGRIVAEQVQLGRIESVDASSLSLSRFDRDGPLVPIGMVF